MRVGVLGLGHMGAPIAERLEHAGHELSVWNRSAAATEPFAQRGIRVLDSPAEVWQHAELAVTMLADDDALKAVTCGEHGLLSDRAQGTAGEAGSADQTTTGRGATLIDMSTVSVRCSAEIAQMTERRGVTYLRAPVSGNPSVVVAGNLTIIVSGPQSGLDANSTILRDVGPHLFYVGADEQARIVKLALNLMLGGTTQLLAEALVLGEHAGMEAEKMLEVINASVIGSPYVKYKTDALVAGDYSSTFTASLLYKDLALALQAAHDVGVPLMLTAATQQLVEGCIAGGMGNMDLSVLIERLRQEAGHSEPTPHASAQIAAEA